MWLFFITALLIIFADQLTKSWVRSYPEGHTIFQEGFFRLVHIQNTGAAFGIFQGGARWLTIVSLIGIAVILFFVLFVLRKLPYLNTRLSRFALSLLLGGTIGNLIDRFYFGNVADFIYISIWPAFNVADSAITIGMICFVCFLLFSARPKNQNE